MNEVIIQSKKQNMIWKIEKDHDRLENLGQRFQDVPCWCISMTKPLNVLLLRFQLRDMLRVIPSRLKTSFPVLLFTTLTIWSQDAEANNFPSDEKQTHFIAPKEYLKLVKRHVFPSVDRFMVNLTCVNMLTAHISLGLG